MSKIKSFAVGDMVYLVAEKCKGNSRYEGFAERYKNQPLRVGSVFDKGRKDEIVSLFDSNGEKIVELFSQRCELFNNLKKDPSEELENCKKAYEIASNLLQLISLTKGILENTVEVTILHKESQHSVVAKSLIDEKGFPIYNPNIFSMSCRQIKKDGDKNEQ